MQMQNCDSYSNRVVKHRKHSFKVKLLVIKVIDQAHLIALLDSSWLSLSDPLSQLFYLLSLLVLSNFWSVFF